MNKRTNRMKMTAVIVFVALALVATGARNTQWVHADSDSIPNNLPQHNPGGMHATFSTQGSVQLTGEYFQAQGTNGRSCASCHTAEDAWGITPGTLRALFDATAGQHPVLTNSMPTAPM